MLIDVTKAIKSRWDARSLSSQISGGIHHSRAPEGTAMPYAIFQEIADTLIGSTRSSRYNRGLLQVDVYDASPDLVGHYSFLIREAFTNSDQAAANPLVASAISGKVIQFEPTANPVTIHEGEEVYRSVQTFAVVYSESRNLSPAV